MMKWHSLAALMVAWIAGLAWADDVRYPPEANVVDITKPPYGAAGDGKRDDTAAFQKALADNVSLIYVPNGTYLLSDTLRWGPNQKRQILQGQSREKTVFKLKDACGGYGDPSNPQAMIWTGKSPAQRFRNSIRDLTVDSGAGNPGAIALQFIANNQGGIFDVTIRSGDAGGKGGAGVIGLDLGYTDEQGPCLIKRVSVHGFDVGISIKHAVDSVTLEEIDLQGQRVAGLVNDGQCVSLRGLTSRNAVPAYVNKAGASLTAMIDSELSFSGEGKGDAAVVNEAGLFARNIVTRGYARAIANSAGTRRDAEGPTVEEFVSHSVLSAFPTPPKSLGLPIKPTPATFEEDPSKWVSITKFGPPRAITLIRQTDNKRFEREDWSEALQRAIDSGAVTIYFPVSKEEYGMYGPVHLRGNLRRMIGLEADWGKVVASNNEKTSYQPDTRAVFILDDGTGPQVTIERFSTWYSAPRFEQRSGRTLVLKNISIYDLETQPGSGDVFLEDVRCKEIDIHRSAVWARQLNPEGHEQPRIDNDGGQFWVLGLKTESQTTIAVTRNGGRSEIVGGFFYANRPADERIRMFVNDNSSFSFTGGGWKTKRGRAFDVIVEEIRDGQTRELTKEQAYGRGESSAVPLYVGYRKPADAPPTAPSDVKADSRGTSRVGVSWRAGTGADGYRVEALDSAGAIVASALAGAGAAEATLARGLSAGQSYSLRVIAFNGAGEAAASAVSARTDEAPAAGAGTGLRGAYFRGEDFEEQRLTRVDAKIDFDWGSDKPEKGLTTEHFTVRWTGQIVPRFGENYAFIVEADDAARLWVDGQLIVDAWDHAKKELGRIDLEAGRRYDIRLEYVERTGNASVRLSWFSPSQPREIVPASQLFPGELNLPVISMVEPAMTLKESDAARAVTVRRTGPTTQPLKIPLLTSGAAVKGRDYRLDPESIEFAPGVDAASFTVAPINDGVAQPARLARIEVPPAATYLASPGVLTVTLLDDDSPAAGGGTGLRGEYFSDEELKTLVASRLDKQIEFGWDKRPPHAGVDPSIPWSARWTGLIQPLYPDEYTFEIEKGVYNGARVEVDGEAIIDAWESRTRRKGGGKTPSEPTRATIRLEAGKKYPLVVEFVSRRSYGAKLSLKWSSARQFEQVVPASQLFPVEK